MPRKSAEARGAAIYLADDHLNRRTTWPRRPPHCGAGSRHPSLLTGLTRPICGS